MRFLKNKLVIGCILVISITINVVLLSSEIQRYKQKNARLIPITFSANDSLSAINYFDSIIQNKPSVKSFYYYSIWTTYCAPCIKEMPLLDSIMQNKNNYFQNIFLTDATNISVVNLIQKKHLKPLNFNFESNNKEFLMQIMKYKKIPSNVFPTHIVFNKKGEIVYYREGDFETKKDLHEFNLVLDSLIKSLN